MQISFGIKSGDWRNADFAGLIWSSDARAVSHELSPDVVTPDYLWFVPSVHTKCYPTLVASV